MSAPDELVFLFDIDNTLLDNDRVQADLTAHLIATVGEASAARYWVHFEALRHEQGYADYLGAMQRLRLDDLNDTRRLSLASFLIDYPFADRVYDGALDALARAATWGTTVLLSDGEAVMQPRKAMRSGLWSAVGGRALIYVHKEAMLADIERLYPARHYVMVDDKSRILSALKAGWGDRVTTVYPRQGHYAFDLANDRYLGAVDITLERIGDFTTLERASFGQRAQDGTLAGTTA